MKKTTKSNKLSAAKIGKIFALSAKGLTQKKIAEKIGCCVSTVASHIHKGY